MRLTAREKSLIVGSNSDGVCSTGGPHREAFFIAPTMVGTLTDEEYVKQYYPDATAKHLSLLFSKQEFWEVRKSSDRMAYDRDRLAVSDEEDNTEANAWLNAAANLMGGNFHNDLNTPQR